MSYIAPFPPLQCCGMETLPKANYHRELRTMSTLKRGERGEDTGFDASGIDRHSGIQIRLNKKFDSRVFLPGMDRNRTSFLQQKSTARWGWERIQYREENLSNKPPITTHTSNSCLLFSVGIVESSCLLRNHKTDEVYIYTSKARLFCKR